MRHLYLAPRPCKALPPGPHAAPLPPDPLRPAAFWKKLPPTSKNSEPLPVQGVTSVMKMPPSSGKRMTCAPHCFSLPTGCTPLLWPRPKARPSGTICPLRIRLLVDFPGCTPFLADIRRGIRRKLIVSITELALLLGLHAAGAYPKSQRAPVGIRPLPSGSSCMNGSHVLQAVFRPVSSRVALWRMGIFP